MELKLYQNRLSKELNIVEGWSDIRLPVEEGFNDITLHGRTYEEPVERIYNE
jgi:hypothetical protein